MSNWRLCVLPLLLGGPDILDSESRRLGNILVAPPRGKAAIDSRRLRPNRVGGTLAIVTTECLRPPGWGAGAWERVDRKAASLGDGPDPSPPRSLSRLTCRRKRQDCFCRIENCRIDDRASRKSNWSTSSLDNLIISQFHRPSTRLVRTKLLIP